MAAPLSMVTLKDGSQVPQSTLETITGNLNYLGGKHFMALIELVEKCRDKNPFDPNSFNDSKKTLQSSGLLDPDGKVPDDIKKVVLNSVTGSGFTLDLVSPLQKGRVTAIVKKNNS